MTPEEEINTTADKMYGKLECTYCKLKEAFKVRARYENEHIQNYLSYMLTEAQATHGLLSPVCGAPCVNLMLPLTQNGIGFPGPQLTPEQQKQMQHSINNPEAGDKE